MYESGDTATENAILAAALIDGKTVIKFASANYQVQDLCHFLVGLGVKMEGIGTTTLTIFGQENLNQEYSFQLSEDPIEAMFFWTAAIVTKSSIVIRRCPLDFWNWNYSSWKKWDSNTKLPKNTNRKTDSPGWRT